MSYSYNRNGNQGGYNYNNNQRSFGRNYNNGGNYNRPQKKKSGCKMGVFAKGNSQGNTYFTGWNHSKSRGLISYFAKPYKGSHLTTAKTSRKEYVNYILEITNHRTKQTHITTCMYNRTDGKVTCDSLGLVMNPKTNYCGTFNRKK